MSASDRTERAFALLSTTFGEAAFQRASGTLATVHFHGHAVRAEVIRTGDATPGSRQLIISVPLPLPGPFSFRCHDRTNTTYSGPGQLLLGQPDLDQALIVIGRPSEVIQRSFAPPTLSNHFRQHEIARTLEAKEGRIQMAKSLPTESEERHALRPPLSPDLFRTMFSILVAARDTFAATYQAHLADLTAHQGPAAAQAFVTKAQQETTADQAHRSTRSLRIYAIAIGGVFLFGLLLLTLLAYTMDFL